MKMKVKKEQIHCFVLGAFEIHSKWSKFKVIILQYNALLSHFDILSLFVYFKFHLFLP